MNKEELCASIDAVASAGGQKWVFECKALIRDFYSSPGCKNMINGFAEDAKARRLQANEYWRFYELSAIAVPGWTLVFSLFHRNVDQIYSFPFYALMLITGPGPLHYTRHALPKDGLEVGSFLGKGEELIAHPGEIVEIHGDQFAYDFRVQERVAAIKFAGNFFKPIHMMFDRESLRAVQWIVADPILSQLISVLNATGEMKDPSARDFIEPFVAHECHFVRWEAIRSLCRVNGEAGWTAIQKARMDPHPHIRAAAGQTIAKYEKVS